MAGAISWPTWCEAEKFDLSREDAAPDVPFNENIWRAVRGENSVMLAPRRSAFVRAVAEKDEDD